MSALTRLLPLTLLVISAPAGAASLVNTPVYDPAAKSYFALIDGSGHNPKYHPGIWVWSEAFVDAPLRRFHGIPGQLARIQSAETRDFLMVTFKLDAPAWIGLRYLCLAKRVIDSSGRDVSQGHFAAWDQKWNQDPGIACELNKFSKEYDKDPSAPPSIRNDAYAPVAIGSVGDGFRWFIKGPAKGYAYYFIEWPTGAR